MLDHETLTYNIKGKALLTTVGEPYGVPDGRGGAAGVGRVLEDAVGGVGGVVGGEMGGDAAVNRPAM